MNNKIWLVCLTIMAIMGYVASSGAQTLKDGTPRFVTTTIIPEKDAIAAGETLHIAIQQNHAPEWHTYWKNPGDSGESITINWTLPEGFLSHEIDFPPPQKIPYGPLMNFGFGGETILLTSITAPETLSSDDVTITADISWLVCRDICVPEFTKATLVLPVASNKVIANETAPELFAKARASLPQKVVWQGMVEEQDQMLKISFDPDPAYQEELSAATDLFFFPEEWGILLNAAPQQIGIRNNRLEILVERDTRPLSKIQNLQAVLTYKTAQNIEKSIFLDVAVTPSVAQNNAALPIDSSAGNGSSVTITQAIFLAVLGGLILNLMPCVFPVLSMKALSLVKMSAKEKKHAALHGVFYTAGILVCFAAIAAVLIGLKAAGEEIGWGFQLQNPMVVLFLAYLLFIMALNMSGFFEFKGHLFSNIGHKLTQNHGYSGTFFTGVLATIVATPCTAPFMGTAMGFALTQSSIVAMSIFMALGIGLALPYLALCLIPPLRKSLPKPGAWMETFRQFMAFPLYASVAWLVWVYAQQVSGGYGVLLALGGMILIAFSVWITRHIPKRQPMKAVVHSLSYASIGLAVVVALLSCINTPVDGRENKMEQTSPAATNNHAPYNKQAYDAAIAGNDPVFVNMTAAWCITCKFNEQIALATDKTRDVFTKNNVVYLQGDWTNQNPEITEFLTSYGRSGVPLYVYIGARNPANGERPEPQVLPQLLTAGLVADIINGENKETKD